VLAFALASTVSMASRASPVRRWRPASGFSRHRRLLSHAVCQDPSKRDRPSRGEPLINRSAWRMSLADLTCPCVPWRR
jgi:hypothetical protein